MSTSETPTEKHQKAHPKENERVVHFTVPESVFNRAKAKAHLTGVPWKVFLQSLMEEGGKFEDAFPES
ncbi:MAG: hypothetical protein R3C12_00120 [Planctomycetaceae bacterium]